MPPSWTLDVEASFYLVLPLIAVAIGALVRRGRPWLRTEVTGLGLAVVASWAYKAWAFHGGPNGHPGLAGLPPSYFDAFAIGMLLAVVALHLDRGGSLPAPVRRGLGAAVLWPAWAAVLVVGSLVGALDSVGGDLYGRNVVYVALGVLPVVPLVLGGPGTGVARRLLSSAPMQFLGTVSYGIYVWHFFVFDLVRRAGFHAAGDTAAYLAWSAVGLVGASALGLASWRLVEAPALTLKRLVPLRRA